jgi:glucosylceramidase
LLKDFAMPRRFPSAQILIGVLLLPAMAAQAQPLRGWVTTNDHAQALAPLETTAWQAGKPPAQSIDIAVDAGKPDQAMVGFGASITDASAWLIQRQSPAQREALLRELFGRQGNGLGLSFTRLTIGASDFSRFHYSLDDTPDKAPDPALKHFSIQHNLTDVVPVTQAALKINPQLKVMASPWSAPAWMKSNRNLVQGTLDPQYQDAFARYLLRYVDAYAQQGIPIWALTVQNEPDFEPKDYPGMRLNARARGAFIAHHLGPLLKARGKNAPLLFDWDHNWDKPDEPLGVLRDPAAAQYVDAIAWHCYMGTPDAQGPVRAAFPDKDLYLTECSGGDWEPLNTGGLVLQARRTVIQSVRHGARGVIFWNLALDERNGPHAGGCDTCRGVVTIDSSSGEVLHRTDEYYALAHLSRFVLPGARRVASPDTQGQIDNVAFVNPDGGRVLVVSNSGETAQVLTFGEGNRRVQATLPAKSLATFTWSPVQ